MSETGILLIFGLFVVLISFGAWLGWKQERDRTEALARIARVLRWSFHGTEKDYGFPGRYGQFACFQRGKSRHAHNRMGGTVEAWGKVLDAEAGDYFYQITSGSGKNRRTTTYRFSYLVVALPFGGRSPEMALRAEGLWDKLAGAVGFEDIDFESAEFSRRYHVSGSDRRFVYDLLHPRMIEWMLDDAPPRFEVRGGVLLMVSREESERWEPVEFKSAVNWATGFLTRWPDYLVRDLNAR